MDRDPEPQGFYDEMNARIAALPQAEQQEAVLRLFGVGLQMMDRKTISELRRNLVEQFPTSSSRHEAGTVLIEILDGHLALRDIRATVAAEGSI